MFIFRSETVSDYAAAEFLTREAFWNKYQPGCEEHYLLHILRGSQSVVAELCDVCEMDGEIVGHILYTHANVVSDTGEAFPVITFGPISVRPDMQGKGIGSQLIRRTMQRASEMGFAGVVITGNPAYYHRFGFRPASDFSLLYEDGSSFPELMAAELRNSSLRTVSGRIRFAPEYSAMKEEDVLAFDAQFPKRERMKLPGQLSAPDMRADNCVTIRPETHKDYKDIVAMILRSFREGTPYSDGTDIIALIEEIRDSKYYIPELSFVAELDGKIVGHFLFSHFPLSAAPDGTRMDPEDQGIVMLAPVAVHPDCFRRGIGSAMLRLGIEQVRKCGYRGITVEGDYHFYNKVGFKTSSEFGIYPTSGHPLQEPRCMMCQETSPGSLRGMQGHIVYDMYHNA
ncbi:MAG: N-acetyltransferase [Clostridia bacterium]|nr:N-acetyltransferase [Clostridia bacterium]